MYFHRRVILFAATSLLSALGAAGEPNPHNCETDNGNGVVCKTRVSLFLQKNCDSDPLNHVTHSLY
jgi:hypothetical protein